MSKTILLSEGLAMKENPFKNLDYTEDFEKIKNNPKSWNILKHTINGMVQEGIIPKKDNPLIDINTGKPLKKITAEYIESILNNLSKLDVIDVQSIIIESLEEFEFI